MAFELCIFQGRARGWQRRQRFKYSCHSLPQPTHKVDSLVFLVFSCSSLHCRLTTGPLGNASNSSQTTPTTAASRMSSSSNSSMFDTPVAANHKRKGSFGTPTHRHKASNGSRDFNAADIIAPSVPRAEMVLTAPVLQQRIHTEPLSDLLFSQHAVYTADACGQVRAF